LSKGDKCERWQDLIGIIYRGVNFVCFELVECVTMSVSSYTWHIINNTEWKALVL